MGNEGRHDIGINDVPSADAEDHMDVPSQRELDEDAGQQQSANESTPAAAVGRKRQREFGSPKVVKKKVIKSAKAVRIESAEKMKSKKDKGKSEEAIKKGFKNNFLTVKFKLSALHVKAGKFLTLHSLSKMMFMTLLSPTLPSMQECISLISREILETSSSQNKESGIIPEIFMCVKMRLTSGKTELAHFLRLTRILPKNLQTITSIVK